MVRVKRTIVSNAMVNASTCLIFNIQHYSLHDGPGIRTTVFMKGCPLHCLWCSNPESISPLPQVGFHKERCAKDYRCKDVCPRKAVSLPKKGGLPEFDRQTCAGCSDHPCIAACPQGALELRGEKTDVPALWREVETDRLFYRNSGGGITLSGGEPTMQPDFAEAFFSRCRQKGLHTALDTCGFVRWEVLSEILKQTDLVLYDLKHMEADRHKELCGVSNEVILENAARIAAEGKSALAFRMPLIPGYNDSDSNIRDTAAFVKKTGAQEITLLPYHRFGTGKYDIIDAKYPLSDLATPREDRFEKISETFRSLGISCTI